MSVRKVPPLLWIAASVLFVTACQDTPDPTAPDADDTDLDRPSETQAFQQQDMAQWFTRAASEVLALPQTVFADHDESAGRLVFGVEQEGAIRGVEAALTRLGIPGSAYEVRVTEPIRFMTTLRGRHRPTIGGIQIHFSMFLCTLGFSVDHVETDSRSFITNSHCTDKQGENSGTIYYQPTSSADPTPIAVEADDPAYFKGGDCPRGRKCRFSDASRALYESGIESLGEIAQTEGANTGSLVVVDTFEIDFQDDTSTEFSGTLNKVGRTTGWTQGEAAETCVTVNVAGSNITLLCQTLVEADQEIVAGGDSGSPVFRTTGSNTAELVGILWGGSSSGDLFVFSPLSSIVLELGDMTATTDGTGSGDGGGGDGGDDDGGDDGPNCPPTSNNPACP